MSTNLPAQPTVLQRICTRYENNLLLPFLIPFLNAVGLGAIDRLASKHATDFQLKRVMALIAALDKKVDKSVTQPGSDDFYATLHTSLDAVMQTQSQEKIERFATVLAGTWESQSSNWNEVSQTLKLIKELEDIHILILGEARAIYLADPEATFNLGGIGFSSSIPIDEKFRDVDEMLLTSCISDLISKGLLNDSFTENEDVDFGDLTATEERPKPAKLAYSISPLGLWFLQKLHSPK